MWFLSLGFLKNWGGGFSVAQSLQSIKLQTLIISGTFGMVLHIHGFIRDMPARIGISI